jgi:hypothetical protein
MLLTFSWWDALLLVAISLHATTIAYVSNPRHKTVILTLPIPFTMAALALGSKVEITHVVGLINLLLYTYSVRFLHQQKKLNIIASIALSVLLYIALGAMGKLLLPRDPVSFWLAGVFVMTMGAWMHFTRKHHNEPGQRSPLPLPIKLPAVMGVVSMLIVIKNLLGGFAATFPMVGSIASYEMRRCLSTNCQAQPLTMMIATPLMLTCRIAQDFMPLPAALALGWVASLTAIALLIPGYLKQQGIAVTESEPALAAVPVEVESEPDV